MTQHVYGDPMVPGLGNRKAWEEFRSKNKPGVYVGMDLNDLKSLNDHSHDMGDEAIRTYGRTLREAADEAAPGTGKLFRVGGDEMTAHFPSNEHAMQFARKLHEKLDALPPLGGVHKISTGMGFGTNPAQADQALLQAKTQKYHPGQEAISERDRKRVFPVGKTPSMAHSLVPGSEGAVPLRNPQTTALAANAELPKPPASPAAAPPEPKMPKPEPPKMPKLPATAAAPPTTPKQPKAA
jgi:GGDEF domain-containing protein